MANEKTAKLLEKAIFILSDLPDDACVYVTGAHIKWLHDLEDRFKAEGLTDVVFLTPHQILRGALRGRKGVLLIDDYWDLPKKDAALLLQEQRMLREHMKMLYGHDER